MSRPERMPDDAPASDNVVASPWSVRIGRGQVPETGRHLDLVADAPVRAAIAKLAGLHVVGTVSATVGQICSVTLEPIENEIDEPIDLVFMPEAATPDHKSLPLQADAEIVVPLDDAPELLIGDTVDLGAIATEFLVLGIDPYPRKAGAVFAAPAAADDSARPFAVLAALKPPAKKPLAKKGSAKKGPGEG
jgi:hypothetical protein